MMNYHIRKYVRAEIKEEDNIKVNLGGIRVNPINISVKGLLFQSEKELKKGQVVEINMLLNDHKLHVRASVVREEHKNEHSRYAVDFEGRGLEDDNLKEFVRIRSFERKGK